MAVSAPARRERILPRFIEEEMRESFIDYSMSVIVQRALPDARDGLKPVHRRILYAMSELGLEPGKPYKKSAAVVGDVLGKYHPHGDAAVYEALVRMAQDFSLRCPLVDGQGNFGSIDGDPAAAYRYTEARLTAIAVELLRDLEKDTVDFRPNFDERLTEPAVMPASFPHLLVNGSDGIAVGMATRIPPHNLREIAAAADALLARPNLSLDKLIEHVQGPDFPTGGIVCGREGIEQAYRTGRGRLVVRARLHSEPGAYGKTALVLTELPYQVTKSRVVEQIAELARAGQLEGLTDIRDESDRDGVRVVIELKRDADPRKVAEQLFKRTQLESTFGVITLALVDGVPRELNLKETLEAWIRHRLQVVVRRARFEHATAKERAHILDGLLKALSRIDEVVTILKGSRTPEAAAQKLRRTLRITATQADAILAMRLARLTGLEHKKLADERTALLRRLKELDALLASEALQRTQIRKELAERAERFGDERRTEILDDGARFPVPTLGADEEFQIFTTWLGYVKAMPLRAHRRNGEPSAAEALEDREGDLVTDTFLCRGDDALLAFTADGSVHAVRAKDLPRGTRASRGRPLAQILDLGSRVEIVSVFPMSSTAQDRFVVTVTVKGKIKRTSLSEYRHVRAGGIIGAKIERGDALAAAFVTDGRADLALVTAAGQAIRFAESEVRPMGRAAAGVRAIALAKKDTVVGLAPLAPDSGLAVGTERGLVRWIRAADLRRQSRGGRGVSVLGRAREPGPVVGVVEVRPGDRVSAITALGEAVLLAQGPAAGGGSDTPRLGRDDSLVALARAPTA